MKTIEERIVELIREQFKSTDGGIMSFDTFAAIAFHHLRELAEDCAKIVDVQIEEAEAAGARDRATGYRIIARNIRALAEPKSK
jgi:hypothetical protein